MAMTSTPDAETIGVYDAKRIEYEAMVTKKKNDTSNPSNGKEPARTCLIEMLPKNASILDYGCGPGMYVRSLSLSVLSVPTFCTFASVYVM